jgi:UDP-GlcNAc:undecaprenyl-phosphate GlcNAc-1-phosphate transferase
MVAYVLTMVGGAVLASILTPLVARFAFTFGLVDAPGGRKVHTASVPRVGGLAVLLATFGALMVARFAGLIGGADSPFVPASLPIIAGASLVFAVGFYDDIRPISPYPRLIVETGAALWVMSSGLLIERATILGTTVSLGWVAWPITLAWILGLTNAFNLIDGVDGLASGVAMIACGTCASILVARGHTAEAFILLALAGGALGFLFFNFSPASIFLGDGGSLLFGFMLASTAIAGWQKGATALTTGVPLLIFALPWADLWSAFFRRLLKGGGRPASLSGTLNQLFTPDRGHIHHRLLALGWSTRRTVAVLYLITLVLSALALASARV